MSAKKWYANAYVLIIGIMSCVAIALAALMFVLLPQSAEVIRLMQWRTVRARTVAIDATIHYDGWLETKGSDGIAKKTREVWGFECRGPLDMSDELHERLGQEFMLRIGADQPTLDFGGELRRLEKADYVRFSVLPEQLGAVKIGPYKEQWLSFDIERLRRNIDSPFFGAPGRTMDELDRQYLIDQFRTTPFLRFVEKLPSVTIGGVSTYHYQVKPEMAYIKYYVIQSEQMRLGRELTRKETEFIDTFFFNVTAENGEVWVGKQDYYLHRLLLRFRYDDTVKRRGVLSLTVDLSKFNEPVSLSEPPGQVQPIDNILRSLLPSAMEHLPLAGEAGLRSGAAAEEEAPKGLPISIEMKKGQADNDNDGLDNALEKFYGTDPNNPDTDGDGMKDGEEVDKGQNPNGPGKLFDFGITSGR
jgi:hypothetical protein